MSDAGGLRRYNPATVRRGLALVPADSPEEVNETMISDGVVDLLVLAFAAGLDWRDIYASVYKHIAAETDSPDEIEYDAELLRAEER